MRSISATITTTAGGAATVYTDDVLNGGYVESLTITGSLDAGTDLTITDDATGAPIVTLTNINTGTFRPRGATHDITGVASLYAIEALAAVEDKIAITGRIKIVVAQGGATTTGAITFIIS